MYTLRKEDRESYREPVLKEYFDDQQYFHKSWGKAGPSSAMDGWAKLEEIGFEYG